MPSWSDLLENSIVRALGISLAAHLFLFTVIDLGNRLGWWQRIWDERIEAVVPQNAAVETETPLTFLEVDPAQAAEEAPSDAKYYSARNSKAGNPEPMVELQAPKLEGTQDKVMQTMTRAKPIETPETAPASAEQSEPPPVAKAAEPGDVRVIAPGSDPADQRTRATELMQAPAPRPRPRRLAEALAAKGLPQEQVRTEGGVKRFDIQGSFDSKATLFGSYDEAIVAAVRNRWYSLLEQRDYVRNASGKVILEFRLKYDGRITDMKVAENEVSEILGLICQRAVLDPQPYAPWPADLRRVVGADYREVRFTFYYN